MWSNHRPKVMSCLCCFTGLAALILASVIYAGRLGNEVELWYK